MTEGLGPSAPQESMERAENAEATLSRQGDANNSSEESARQEPCSAGRAVLDTFIMGKPSLSDCHLDSFKKWLPASEGEACLSGFQFNESSSAGLWKEGILETMQYEVDAAKFSELIDDGDDLGLSSDAPLLRPANADGWVADEFLGFQELTEADSSQSPRLTPKKDDHIDVSSLVVGNSSNIEEGSDIRTPKKAASKYVSSSNSQGQSQGAAGAFGTHTVPGSRIPTVDGSSINLEGKHKVDKKGKKTLVWKDVPVDVEDDFNQGPSSQHPGSNSHGKSSCHGKNSCLQDMAGQVGESDVPTLADGGSTPSPVNNQGDARSTCNSKHPNGDDKRHVGGPSARGSEGNKHMRGLSDSIVKDLEAVALSKSGLSHRRRMAFDDLSIEDPVPLRQLTDGECSPSLPIDFANVNECHSPRLAALLRATTAARKVSNANAMSNAKAVASSLTVGITDWKHRAFSDVQLLETLHRKFDAARAEVNMELAAFVADVEEMLEKHRSRTSCSSSNDDTLPTASGRSSSYTESVPPYSESTSSQATAGPPANTDASEKPVRKMPLPASLLAVLHSEPQTAPSSPNTVTPHRVRSFHRPVSLSLSDASLMLPPSMLGSAAGEGAGVAEPFRRPVVEEEGEPGNEGNRFGEGEDGGSSPPVPGSPIKAYLNLIVSDDVETELEQLLALANKCARMPAGDFRRECEGIVQALDDFRRKIPMGPLKQLHTRMLFILTRCTRLLQFQKENGYQADVAANARTAWNISRIPSRKGPGFGLDRTWAGSPTSHDETSEGNHSGTIPGRDRHSLQYDMPRDWMPMKQIKELHHRSSSVDILPGEASSLGRVSVRRERKSSMDDGIGGALARLSMDGPSSLRLFRHGMIHIQEPQRGSSGSEAAPKAMTPTGRASFRRERMSSLEEAPLSELTVREASPAMADGPSSLRLTKSQPTSPFFSSTAPGKAPLRASLLGLESAQQTGLADAEEAPAAMQEVSGTTAELEELECLSDLDEVEETTTGYGVGEEMVATTEDRFAGATAMETEDSSREHAADAFHRGKQPMVEEDEDFVDDGGSSQMSFDELAYEQMSAKEREQFHQARRDEIERQRKEDLDVRPTPERLKPWPETMVPIGGATPGRGPDGTAADVPLICRICLEGVLASDLQSHSRACALVDRCDLKGKSVDDRIGNVMRTLGMLLEMQKHSAAALAEGNLTDQVFMGTPLHPGASPARGLSGVQQTLPLQRANSFQFSVHPDLQLRLSLGSGNGSSSSSGADYHVDPARCKAFSKSNASGSGSQEHLPDLRPTGLRRTSSATMMGDGGSPRLTSPSVGASDDEEDMGQGRSSGSRRPAASPSRPFALIGSPGSSSGSPMSGSAAMGLRRPFGMPSPAPAAATVISFRCSEFVDDFSEPSVLTRVEDLWVLCDIALNDCTDPEDRRHVESLWDCIEDMVDIIEECDGRLLVAETFARRVDKLFREKFFLFLSGDDDFAAKEDVCEEDIESSEIKNRQRMTPLHPLMDKEHRTSIDDFDIIKAISRGAYGRVFLARKLVTDDIFAIKVLKKKDMIRKNAVESVMAERDILVSVRNPFVVRFFYSFTCHENLYLVMEYLPGGDLFSLLRLAGCLEEEVARKYIAEVVVALEYLHSLGVVHRDLKPDNLLIDGKGHIKLTDFGLSRFGLINNADVVAGGGDGVILPEEAEEDKDQQKEAAAAGASPQPSQQANNSDEDRQAQAVGTPDYLAPEILLGCAHGHAVDWWAVGIILFELLVGIPPFNADTPEKIFDNILNRNIPWPKVPEEMSYLAQDLIDRLLNPEPSERLGAHGSEEVKQHPFFKGVEWDRLEYQEPAFVPSIEHDYFIPREMGGDADEASDKVSTSSEEDDDSGGDEHGALPELDSANKYNEFKDFSFKNLSQLAYINDLLVQQDGFEPRSSPGHDVDFGPRTSS